MTIFQNMNMHMYSKRKNANLKRRIKHGALIDHSQRKQGKYSFFTLSLPSFFAHWLSLLRLLTHSKYSSFHSLPPKTMVFFLKICREAFQLPWSWGLALSGKGGGGGWGVSCSRIAVKLSVKSTEEMTIRHSIPHQTTKEPDSQYEY